MLSRKVLTIQSGSEEAKLYYQVVVELEDNELRAGEDMILAEASMPVAVSIVYESETYLQWILEQLNFLKLD